MTTVTAGGWSVSTMTGWGIDGAILHVYKHKDRPSGWKYDAEGRKIPCSNTVFQNGEGYGRQFKSSDEAFAWAFQHGYLEHYYSRTWCRQHRTLHTFMGKPSPTFGACYR